MAGSRTLKLSILADVDDLKKKLDVGANEVEGFGGKLEKRGEEQWPGDGYRCENC